MHSHSRFMQHLCKIVPFFCILFSLCSTSTEERLPLISEADESQVADVTDSLSQNGVTWYFKDLAEYGQFANGDYWIKGPVIITRITPDFNGQNHGWEVNPSPLGHHGFDIRIEGYDSAVVPESQLPYTAQPGESIIKAVSREPYTEKIPMETRLSSASVLTILADVPVGNGKNFLRPPYVGTDKPLYSIANIRTELLPSLAPVPGAPSLEEVAEDFRPVQMNHRQWGATAYLPPEKHLPNYAPANAVRFHEGLLRVMLDDPITEKMDALINLLQYGMDYYHFSVEGHTWPRGGGEQPGNKLPIVFFATLLGDENVQRHVKDLKLYDDYHTYYNEDSLVLWGDIGWDNRTYSEIQYWKSQAMDIGSRTIADPYGYIDGGKKPGDWYQHCCTSQPFKGIAICLLLMPEMLELWYPKALIEYADRWVEFGTWTQPDPCAPADGNWDNYGITYGADPNNPGDCIRDTDSSDGIGRFPEMHGKRANTGSYGSGFVNEMWNAYR